MNNLGENTKEEEDTAADGIAIAKPIYYVDEDMDQSNTASVSNTGSFAGVSVDPSWMQDVSASSTTTRTRTSVGSYQSGPPSSTVSDAKSLEYTSVIGPPNSTQLRTTKTKSAPRTSLYVPGPQQLQQDPLRPPEPPEFSSVRSFSLPTTHAESPLDSLGPESGASIAGKTFFRSISIIHYICAVLVILVVVLLVLQLKATAPSPLQFMPPVSAPVLAPTIPLSTIETVRANGMLRCGVVDALNGFSWENSDSGIREGFEVDLCRAIAAAVHGPGYKLELIPLTPSGRFIALQNRQVDVLASHTTNTMERDVFEATSEMGLTFSSAYLYDGLTFGGQPEMVECAESLIVECTGGNSSEYVACAESISCLGLRICVVEETTHFDQVMKLFPSSEVSTINPQQSLDAAYDSFVQSASTPSRGCNIIAGGRFQVSGGRFQVAEAKFSFQLEQMYKVGAGIFSNEPLALVTRDDDPFWSDIVEWVLQALIGAEEEGVDQNSADSTPTTPYFGTELENLFRNAIAEVGSFKEMYERHLSIILPRGEINEINCNSGQIFSLPLGSIESAGPSPVDGNTLKQIRDRGHLRCGINEWFAAFDAVTNQWKGLDVDLCRAISAAIFNGVADHVVYTVIPATERFKALARGDLDVLSRITTRNLERDVAERTTGVGFDFSQTYFYDSIRVGGIPPYGKCADNQDQGAECQNILVCVNEGTTTFDVANKLFPAKVLVGKPTGVQAVEGLVRGDCQAVISPVLEIVLSSLQELGFTGSYEVGSNRFSKEPFCLVTRQDDPQFSAFVKLVLTSTFYAEEQGIDQSVAKQMPRVSLFGPLFERMLIDVIRATGHYGEIYERNMQLTVPRGGLNALNGNPRHGEYGPRLYPFPGIWERYYDCA